MIDYRFNPFVKRSAAIVATSARAAALFRPMIVEALVSKATRANCL
jgi:hypothetical protein